MMRLLDMHCRQLIVRHLNALKRRAAFDAAQKYLSTRRLSPDKVAHRTYLYLPHHKLYEIHIGENARVVLYTFGFPARVWRL